MSEIVYTRDVQLDRSFYLLLGVLTDADEINEYIIISYTFMGNEIEMVQPNGK